MSESIASEKVTSKGIGFSDLIIAGAIKYFEERLLAPYIGNGTIMSGAAKIIAAKMLGKSMPKSVKLALAIDGAEDIVVALLGNLNIGQSGASNTPQVFS
jgi:hypothetical protein